MHVKACTSKHARATYISIYIHAPTLHTYALISYNFQEVQLEKETARWMFIMNVTGH